jgi:4-hydroxy-3-methylbut-2-enyl diphosphate reductase
MTHASPLIFRRGLGLNDAVAGLVTEGYSDPVIDRIRSEDFTYRAGRVTIHLAREFGFCYGVDRAINYAYQTIARFSDRRVFLTDEIIHNPQVNAKLRAMGVAFLSDVPDAVDHVQPADVVILPAFGVAVAMLQRLERRGCTLVDTTCGSVLNVWKNVRRYADSGFTSVIHGKPWHEETRATASQAVERGGHYLVVHGDSEAQMVCDYIRRGGDRQAFLVRAAGAVSDGFDPDRDLERLGLANQTTMLMVESLAIGDTLKAALVERWGASNLAAHFQSFDTICSATQDRQNAVLALLRERTLDVMIVVGGYNSSNTANLARACADTCPTFHVSDAGCLVSADRIRHWPAGSSTERITEGWLPPGGRVSIGVTSGASTPDNTLAETILKIDQLGNSTPYARCT